MPFWKSPARKASPDERKGDPRPVPHERLGVVGIGGKKGFAQRHRLVETTMSPVEPRKKSARTAMSNRPGGASPERPFRGRGGRQLNGALGRDHARGQRKDPDGGEHNGEERKDLVMAGLRLSQLPCSTRVIGWPI